MNFLIGILVCILGFLLGKKSANDEILKYYQQSVESEKKAARVNMVIRSYRNQLLREETKIRALSKSKQ